MPKLNLPIATLAAILASTAATAMTAIPQEGWQQGVATPAGEVFTLGSNPYPLETNLGISFFLAAPAGSDIAVTVDYLGLGSYTEAAAPGPSPLSGTRFGDGDLGPYYQTYEPEWLDLADDRFVGIVGEDVTLTVTSPTATDYGYRFDYTPTPEPSTWAIMLLGFGLLGATLRRRAEASAVPATVSRWRAVPRTSLDTHLHPATIHAAIQAARPSA